MGALNPVGTCRSLIDFVETVRDLSQAPRSFYTFRGQQDARWETLPGLLRPDRQNLLAREREIIREIRAVHPQEFAADETMFDRLVRMQHFDLPTRLLDVTANPLVALYFATETSDTAPADGKVSFISVPEVRRKFFDSDTVSCLSNLANLSEEEKADIYAHRTISREAFNNFPSVGRLLQFIRMEKPYFRAEIDASELDRIWYVRPKLSNRRILAQTGAFLLFGLTPVYRGPAPSGSEAIKFSDLIIPYDNKDEIRSELDTFGINESSLFPEIDRAAGYIVSRYS